MDTGRQPPTHGGQGLSLLGSTRSNQLWLLRLWWEWDVENWGTAVGHQLAGIGGAHPFKKKTSPEA